MKQTIIIAMLLTITFYTEAQDFSIGLTGGFGHSRITNFDGYDTKFNPAWNAGLSFINSSKTKLGLGIDVKYSTEGIKNKYLMEGLADGLISVTNTVNANYIRVPVKLIYFFGKHGSPVRPKIYIGPDFGFLTGGESVLKYGDVKYKTSEVIKNFDLGTIIAAGLNFRIAPAAWLNTDVAYYNGFTDVSKDTKKSYNRNFQLNVGLLVGLKRNKHPASAN